MTAITSGIICNKSCFDYVHTHAMQAFPIQLNECYCTRDFFEGRETRCPKGEHYRFGASAPSAVYSGRQKTPLVIFSLAVLLVSGNQHGH